MTFASIRLKQVIERNQKSKAEVPIFERLEAFGALLYRISELANLILLSEMKLQI